MAHHDDYDECTCRYCGRKFYIRAADASSSDDYLYCSSECAAADKFPAGWFNKGAETKRQKIKRTRRRWV